MNPGVFILRGPSGCGKSTTARAMQYGRGGVIISRDNIRQMFGATGKTVLDPSTEKKVTQIEQDLIRGALYRGDNVFVDDTNLNAQTAAKWADLAHVNGVKYTEVNLYDPLEDETYLERSDIPEDAVRRQLRTAKKMRPISEFVRVPRMTPIVQDETLPPAILCDIDGTIADSTGLRSPYDYSKVAGDRVIEPVAGIVRSLSFPDPTIVFVSGRSEDSRTQTMDWLRTHIGYHIELHMRKTDDDRHDAVIKREILEKLSKTYYVIGAIDDRKRVIDMWRASGIHTFDVNQTREDF